MANVSSRQELIDYAKRTLGEPLVKVNISPEQADDRVDEALQMFWDYHHDGTERVIVKHQVTAQDKQNEFLYTPTDIIGITRVWYSNYSTSSIWTVMFFNKLWLDINTPGSGMSSYIKLSKDLEELDSLFRNKVVWQYNRNSNKLYLQIDWSQVKEGDYIVYEAIMAVNPDTNPEVWNDPWLKAYFVELMRKQWGMNLSKFKNVELPGGMTIDGDQLVSEANENLTRMKEEMLEKYSFIGQIFLG